MELSRVFDKLIAHDTVTIHVAQQSTKRYLNKSPFARDENYTVSKTAK
jgi:hypothetical protein